MKPKTANDISKEYGHSLSLNTEAMDYFFDTFFTANFKEALNITSLSYRRERTVNAIENEWRRFYNAVNEHGMNRKNLSYRTNPYGTNSDIGAVISPSGRVIIAVYLAKTKEPVGEHSGWQVDDVRFFFEALEVESENGLERVVLTDKPSHSTYKALTSLVSQEYKEFEDLEQDNGLVTGLIVSDGWARMTVLDKITGGPLQILFKVNADNRWTVVTAGTDLMNFDYPESPYKLWLDGDDK